MKKTFNKKPPRVLGRKKSVSAQGGSALGGKIAKQIPRPWGLATRLEYRRIKGKGSGR